MSRTTISFDTDEEGAQAGGAYNEFLLHQAAILGLEAISFDLTGRSVREAANVIDILAPFAADSAAVARWQCQLGRAASEMEISIEDAPWMLSDQGWRPLAETSLLPMPSNPIVLDANLLREHAAFPAYAEGLDTRTDSIKSLSEVRDSRRQNTDLHKRLTDAKLVNTFRREDVLADILTPNLPTMPVARGTADAALCRDALFYSLRLAETLASRGEGESLAKAMAKIPVPCRGGWYPLSQATFGKGWIGTRGAAVDRYLRLVGTESAKAARARLLCDPEDPDWGEFGETVRPLLERAGVIDGLPLMVIGGKEPAFFCQVSHYRFQAHSPAPPALDQATWSAFISKLDGLRSSYKSGRYKINAFRWLPGLEARTSFSDEARCAAKRDRTAATTPQRHETLGDKFLLHSIVVRFFPLQGFAQASIASGATKLCQSHYEPVFLRLFSHSAPVSYFFAGT